MRARVREQTVRSLYGQCYQQLLKARKVPAHWRQARALYRRWERGESICALDAAENTSPMMLARVILAMRFGMKRENKQGMRMRLLAALSPCLPQRSPA